MRYEKKMKKLNDRLDYLNDIKNTELIVNPVSGLLLAIEYRKIAKFYMDKQQAIIKADKLLGRSDG